jgi:hypothetical protein
MIPLAAEEATPTWIPLVAFAVPVLIVGAVLIPAIRLRRRASRGRRAQSRHRATAVAELGSADSIDDPVPYSIDALLTALAVRPEDHGPTEEGLPHDEGWSGTMLGLRSRVSSSTSVLEPHVYWGTREGRQVFIRVGLDEKIQGGTTLLSNRHNRCITVLRVAAPSFDIVSERGALRASGESPAGIHDLVKGLTRDPATWSDSRIAGGPEGIVAARSAIDGTTGSWPYDLWLLERIARVLDLSPLKPARIGPRWKVPYGFGRSLEPDPR